MTTTKTYQVTVPGGDLHVKKWTPNTCQYQSPIVLIHDSLGSVELWRDFPSLLANHLSREVIAYDRLGFGHSSARQELPSDEFIWEEGQVYFPLLKQQLSLNEYVLFGHSVGGAMSVGIAANDSKCLAVITESSQAFIEELTLEGIRQTIKMFQQAGQIERLQKWHGDKANWMLRAWAEKWLSPEFQNWSVEPYITKMDCPLLAIHGDNDEYGSVAFPQYFVENCGGESHMEIIENCGHVPHRQFPEKILDICEKFLLEHDIA